MTFREDLTGIFLLRNLDPGMLDRLRPHIRLARYGEGDTIFREGDASRLFYMIKAGKILLQKRIAGTVMVALGSVKRGHSFGWSAVFENPYTVYAVCAEDSEILHIDNRKMIALMNEDQAMGYRLMQHLSKIIKDRMDRMEEQFMRAIRENSDFREITGQKG